MIATTSPTHMWPDIAHSHSPETVLTVGTLLVQLLAFWLPALAYLLLDIFQPAWSRSWKVQPSRTVTPAELRRCLRVVLQNQLLVSLPLQLAMHYVSVTHPSLPPTFLVSPSLPSLPSFARDFAISLLVREVLFYYSHRLLHTSALYRRIHKTHHQFSAPVSLSAQYAHPIEHVFANVLPVVAGPVLLRTHVLTFWTFLAFELVETVTVHSGYDVVPDRGTVVGLLEGAVSVPGGSGETGKEGKRAKRKWRGISRFHDFHHETFNKNFGALGWLDALHGTAGGRE